MATEYSLFSKKKFLRVNPEKTSNIVPGYFISGIISAAYKEALLIVAKFLTQCYSFQSQVLNIFLK